MKRWIPFLKTPPHVAVIRLQGAIGTSGRGLSDRGLADVIDKAFRSKPAAVALEISSPGGSPVQSSLIAARIRRLADEKDIPVVAFVEDVAASGGYWLATAADEIFVDRGSIVGSIGVISAGFGLTGTLDKLGAERRVYTAGKSKSMLDPFQAEKPADVKRLKGLLDDMHDYFKDQVTSRRGRKLADQDLFTGEIWVGAKSIDVGLADKIGHLVPVMKDRFGDKVTFRRFGKKKPFLGRLGVQIVDDAVAGIEERAAYARFGL
ncbi:S49 family peptidase [Octadecabacter sp. 1_MG-2023]|uniref:S49 family peptidase n=1 Tax=unclassified Octadecabacter TaxID=196158 RepID=UPI001C0A1158|nr:MULTISPECIES: S49 family peptidase [unclassified Octadecabacter]MBU2994129.1 S49 family peptidase [Octadecabacter sp. B2R22]MDO6734582.1 S49 family peptidase [Octadecabacter sp. 1_MG-2023]